MSKIKDPLDPPFKPRQKNPNLLKISAKIGIIRCNYTLEEGWIKDKSHWNKERFINFAIDKSWRFNFILICFETHRSHQIDPKCHAQWHGPAIEAHYPHELILWFEACQMKGTHKGVSELTLEKSELFGLLRIRPLHCAFGLR